MANGNADIQLLFGVFGGDGFGQGSSGKLIQDQLTEIVKQINAKPFEIKFKADETSLKSITEKIQKSIGTVTVNTNKGAGTEQQDQRLLKSVTAYNNALSKLESIRHTIEAGKDTLFSTKDSEAVKKYSGDIDTLTSMLTELRKNVDGGITRGKFDKEFSALSLMTKETSNHIKELTADIKAMSTEVSIPLLGDNQTVLNNSLSKIEALWHSANNNKSILAGLGNTEEVRAFTAQIGSLKGQLEALRTTAGSKTKQEFDKELSAISLEAKKTTNSISEYVKGLKASSSAEVDAAAKAEMLRAAEHNVAQTMKTITDARTKYAAASVVAQNSTDINKLDAYEIELNKLSEALKNGSITQEQFNASLASINGGVANAVRSLSSYGSSAISVFSSIKSQLGDVTAQLLQFYSARMIFMRVVGTIKDMVNNAIDLESAFADTRIVTHATTEELSQYGITITAIANETAASIESLVSATTTFARLGFSLEESTMLAKFTGMLEKVGNVDTQRAEDAITSILKAFPDEVNVRTIESAMDALVKTGNEFPISVSQIAEGMTNASSALAAAGNSFEQSIALLTAANTTVQNASKASTALRTISARLRKTTTDIEDGEAITEAKYQELINILSHHRVSLLDVNNEFKSTYEILESIANVWGEMTSLEQSAVADAIAGTRQQVVFYSIIDHFQEATGAMEAMSQSAGTLGEAYGIYVDTAAAHLERFNIAWKTFSMDAVNGTAIKGIIDIGTAFLNVADALQRAHMLIPTIILTVNAVKALRLSNELRNARKAVDFVVNGFMNLASASEDQIVITKSLEAQFLSLSASEQQQVLAQLNSKVASESDAAAKAMQAIEVSGLAAAEDAATASTDALNMSTRAMMASNPVGWIMAIISVVISAGVAIKGIVDRNAEAAKSIEDINNDLKTLSNNVDQVASDIKNVSDKSKEIIPRFVELANGVDRFGQKTEELTDEEYAEFVDLTNQLADLFPQIKYGIDESGNAMVDLDYTSSNLADTLWRIVEAQREMSRIELAKNLDDAVSAVNSENDIFSREKSSIESAISAVKEFKDEILGGQNVNEYAQIFNTDIMNVLKKAAPEIEDVISSLGRGQEASGALTYALLGGDYSSPDEFIADIDKIIRSVERELEYADRKSQSSNAIAYNYVKQTAIAWAQGQMEYSEASDILQEVIETMIGNIDMSKISATSGDELRSYIYNNIIIPMSELPNSATAAVTAFKSAVTMFASGTIGADNMAKSISGLRTELESSGVSADKITQILDVLGATEVEDKINKVRDSIVGENDAILDFMNSLSSYDLNIVYNIVSEAGSLSLDDIIQKLNDAKNAALEVQEAVEEATLDDFLEDLSSSTSKIDSITSAMQKLQKGTSLTVAELVKLAQQFPELLSQSDLFTDGSIAGQERMLQFMLEANKKEYDSKVDTKVAQLNVEIESAKAQVELEKSKQKLRDSINKKAIDGLISQDTAYLKEVVALNELNAKSFATLEDGKVTVNEATLNTMNKETGEALGGAVNNLWDPYGQAIVQIHEEAAWASLVAEQSLMDGTAEVLRALGNTATLATYLDPDVPMAAKSAIDKAVSNFGGGIDLSPYTNFGNAIGYQHTAYSGSVSELTSGYSGVQEWYDAATKNSAAQIAAWEKAIEAIEHERDNINALKDAIDASSLDDIVKDVASSAAEAASRSSSSNERTQAYNLFLDWYKGLNHKLNMIEAGVDPNTIEAPYTGLTRVQYIVELAQTIKRLLDNGDMTTEESYKYLEEVAKAVKSFSDNAKKAIDDLVNYRAKALKAEKEQEKKDLNDKLKSLKDFYNSQKELIKSTREEEKYLDEQSEKRAKVAELKSQLAMLKYDTSAWGRKKIAEITKELEQAEKDLTDFEKDRASENAQDLLDEEYDKQEKQIQAAISDIESILSDPNAIYNQALSDIQANSKEIYQELKAYGEKNKNGISNEAEQLIETMNKAIKTYEEYISRSTGQAYSGGYNGVLVGQYASGTPYASRGWHIIDEHGSETIFESSNGTKYKMFSGGEKVLDAKASEFLYNFASIMGSNISASSMRSSRLLPTIGSGVTAGVIKTGDIIINGSASEMTISEIRRAQRDQVSTLLSELARLK